jgi:hypothetical protein
MLRFGQAAVVLGTDCCAQWWHLHFSKRNSISVQPFEHDSVCLRAFESLISSISDRQSMVAPMWNISEGGGGAGSDGSGSFDGSADVCWLIVRFTSGRSSTPSTTTLVAHPK